MSIDLTGPISHSENRRLRSELFTKGLFEERDSIKMQKLHVKLCVLTVIKLGLVRLVILILAICGVIWENIIQKKIQGLKKKQKI